MAALSHDVFGNEVGTPVGLAQMSQMGYNTLEQPHKVATAMLLTSGGVADSLRRTDDMNHSTPNSSALKVCKTCGESKPLTEYSNRRANKDGLREHCKACSNAASRAYHHAHRESRIEKITEYRLGNKEKLAASERTRRADPAYQAKSAAKLKEWREKNREHVAAYNRRAQVKARSAVNSAVRRGELPPPYTMVCDGCGEVLAAQYHHFNGYEREHWFDIAPMCTECHGRKHRAQ